MLIRMTIIDGPYRGLIGHLSSRRFDGMILLVFPPGTYTVFGASVERGVFDPRWVVILDDDQTWIEGIKET